MELNDFVEKFSEQFDDTDSSVFSGDTNFKTLEEWSSLLALSTIAMVDESYAIKIKGDDIKNSNTIEDLYQIVKSRL